MPETDPSAPSELKTFGLTPLIYVSNQPLFRVSRDVPLADALAMASDFLFLAKELNKDGVFNRDTDWHIWAAHYLTAMSKGLVDDVMKVLERPARIKTETTK